MSSCAVASMSALAEVYHQDTPLSSIQIAESRGMSHPVVAKVLTILAQHQLIHGTRGPGGGYRLIRQPETITLFEVVRLFEGNQDTSVCPFGPGWCGVGAPCPLHDELIALKETAAGHLKAMHFGDFVKHPKRSYTDP